MTTFKKTLFLGGSFYLGVSNTWDSLSCCYMWEVLTLLLKDFTCTGLQQRC